MSKYYPLWLTDNERDEVREALVLRIGDADEGEAPGVMESRDRRLSEVVGRMDSPSIPLVLDWDSRRGKL